MKLKPLILLYIFILLICLTFYGAIGLCEDLASKRKATLDTNLDEILGSIEKKYSSQGFSAKFTQESTLKAMEITNRATGKIMFKFPGMMRWEYETPEKQSIISNGSQLWIFRPKDNQVIIGKARDFFQNGQGGAFLTDIKILRQQFHVSLVKINSDKYYKLKLVPIKENLDMDHLFLKISKKTFHVVEIITYSAYNDENLICFTDIQFRNNIDNAVFNFKIPEGTDLVSLDEL